MQNTRTTSATSENFIERLLPEFEKQRAILKKQMDPLRQEIDDIRNEYAFNFLSKKDLKALTSGLDLVYEDERTLDDKSRVELYVYKIPHDFNSFFLFIEAMPGVHEKKFFTFHTAARLNYLFYTIDEIINYYNLEIKLGQLRQKDEAIERLMLNKFS